MNQGDHDGSILPPQDLERAWGREHQRLHRLLLQRPALLPQGSTLLVAVSGGQDSMALLGLLLGLRRLHHWQLRLWHGDHGWRPEAGQQAGELQAWCDQQRLSLHIARGGQLPSPTGESSSERSEAAARRWRYQALETCARATGSSHVVTGHTANDRAETLLLHLARGSHRRGLASLPFQRLLSDGDGQTIQLCRPLLIFSRAETAQICADLHLPIWLDGSNDDRRFSRNRVRHDVLPVLEQLHPGAARRLSGTAERLLQEQACLSEWVDVALQWLRHNEQSDQLQRDRLVGLQLANQAAVLEHWLRRNGTACADAQHLRALLQRWQRGRPPGQADLMGGWQLRWTHFTLELIPPHIQAR